MAKKPKSKNELVAFDFENATEHIVEENIADMAEEWKKLCGANQNLYRYFPSAIDGLKPVQRRFLYMMYKNKFFHGNYAKLSICDADTVNLHPHGDDNIAFVAGGMAKEWENNFPVIHIPANKGYQNGTKQAADRYLEVTISDGGYDCYFDHFANSGVEMSLAYTDKMYEPEYLPAKYPIALVNGALSGIGYGLASNVMMFNFKEVCEAAIAIMHDPKAKLRLIPDSPAGSDIVITKEQIKEINEIGDSNIVMRAHAEIDYAHNIIVFTAIPLQINTAMITVALVKLKLAGKLDDVVEWNDHTSELNGVYFEIILRPDANPEEVLEKLYKMKTCLSKGYSAKFHMIDDFRNTLYSVRKFLIDWLEYDRDRVRASFNSKLIALEEAKHINDIKIFIFGGKNGEKTIATAKSSKNVAEYKQKLMDMYGITSLQAKIIADMGTSSWTQDAYEGFLRKRDELEREIKETNKVLEEDDAVERIIEEELREGISRYGEERRSQVFAPGEKVIDDGRFIVGISEDGFIKKVSSDERTVGAIGKQPGVLNMCIPATNTDSILVFDNSGLMHFINVNSLPKMKGKNSGVPIARYSGVIKGSTIVSAILAPKLAMMAETESNIILTTKNGYVKIVSLSTIVNSRKNLNPTVSVIGLTEGDSVSSVIAANDVSDVIVYTNLGDGIRLPLEEIPKQNPPGRGSKCITLRRMETVQGVSLIGTDDKYMIIVTSAGKVKKTELQYFPVMKKKDEPLPLVGLDEKETLVAILSASDGEHVTFYKKQSDAERLTVKEIPLGMRIAKATKMLKVPKGDSIVGISKN